MNFFEHKCRARKRSILRQDIRAIQKLSDSDDPYSTSKLFLEGFNRITLEKEHLKDSPEFMGVEDDQIVNCIKQIILYSTVKSDVALRLTKAVHGSGNLEILPFPPAFRQYLRSRGIAFAPLRSAIAWNFLKAHLLLGGLRRIVKILLVINRKRPAHEISFSGCSVFMRSEQFVNFEPNEIEKKWSFVSWYRKSSFSHISNIIFHRLDGYRSVGELPEGLSISDTYFTPSCVPEKKWRLLFDLARAALKAVVNFFGRKWWHAVLLREIADLAHARSVPKDSFAKQYFIPLNHFMIRYLWTYMAEVQGSEFAVLHYSHSCKEFHPISPDYKPPNYFYAMTSWPLHVVWGEQHVEGLKENGIVNVTYIIDPPIFYKRPETIFPNIDGPVVVLFDIDTPTLSGWANNGFRNPFLCRKSRLEFIKQGALAIRRAGATPVLKPKTLENNYSFWAECAKANDIFLLPEEMIATVAIENSAAVLSMPFTTTGAVATKLGKPSCYFDPTGMLDGFDHYAYSARLVVGIDALDIWLKDKLCKA